MKAMMITKANRKAGITRLERDIRTGWVRGEFLGYRFCAKIYGEGSRFGIEGGRISKLSVIPPMGRWNQLILNYDRGWDVYEMDASDAERLIEILENLPS